MHSRQLLTSFLAIGLTFLAFCQVDAQQSYRKASHRSASQAEQTARTRWQPTRPQASPQSDTGVQQAAHQAPVARNVRRTQATGELPSPAPIQPKPLPQSEAKRALTPQPLVDLSDEGYEVPMHGHSVMESAPHSAQPLDGEIIYDSAPYMDGTMDEGYISEGYGCDSMGGSCGVGGCGNGCDSLGCSGTRSCGCRDCCSGAWRPCLTLCFPQDGWVSLEYLFWTQKGMNLPPLVTSSRSTIDRDEAGVLGLNTTNVLFGGEEVLDDGFSGGRLQFGFWLDKCHLWGIGAEYFELGQESESFSRSSSGDPALARPFFNVLTGREDSELVAFRNVLTGEVEARATSELVGAGFHLRHQTNCYSGCARDWFCGGSSMVQSRTDMLFGYRYLELSESVQINEDLTSSDTAEPGAFLIEDRFETRNQFNGFDLGLLYNRRRGMWSLDLLVKLAIGNTHQQVDINGSTRINGAAAQPGGLLAQTSNIGSYERDEFTILSELGITGGYHLTPNFRLKAGYTMIFWSNVVRPGDQIDLDVNPNFLPPAAVPFTGANRPGFEFVDSDYYVHGLNLGAEFNW